MSCENRDTLPNNKTGIRSCNFVFKAMFIFTLGSKSRFRANATGNPAKGGYFRKSVQVQFSLQNVLLLFQSQCTDYQRKSKYFTKKICLAFNKRQVKLAKMTARQTHGTTFNHPLGQTICEAKSVKYQFLHADLRAGHNLQIVNPLWKAT